MTRDEELSGVFDGLSHPRRVRIFRLLLEHPEAGRTLNSLREATGYKETPLLHHLGVMERAGVIRKKRVGVHVKRVVAPGPLTGAVAEMSRSGLAQGVSP